jgi:hypothetical protein
MTKTKLTQPHKFYRVLSLIKGGFGPMEALESEFGKDDWNKLELLYEELADKYPNAVRAYERREVA